MTTVVADVHAVLSTTPERWQQLIRTLPPALLSRAPAAGEWSALQCLVHLLDAERVNFPVRVQAVLAGQDLAAFDPNRAPSDRRAQTPDQLATAFARARQDSLVLLEQLREDDLARTAQHPAFGPVTLAQLLATWAAHDLNHTVQAERALMQPFLLSCGAWRSFFEDHAVGGRTRASCSPVVGASFDLIQKAGIALGGKTELYKRALMAFRLAGSHFPGSYWGRKSV